LQLWRFNENYRQFYAELLARAVDVEILSTTEKEEKLTELANSIETVNPLHVRFIENN